MLVNSAQNLQDDPSLKKTLGEELKYLTNISSDDKGYPLTLEEYIIFQKKYFEETGKHLDEKNLVVLSSYITADKDGNYSGSQICSGRDKDTNKLGIETCKRERQDEKIGVRESYHFTAW